MPSENVQVAVFVRPYNEKEQKEECKYIVEANGGEINVYNRDTEKTKNFKFDYSFCSVEESNSSCISRSQAIEELGNSLLSSAFKGYNVCIFSYGASESGKSCAMFGTDTSKGLIPWVCGELFVRAEKYDSNTSFRAEISFLEIHKEFVKDLLGKRRNWQDSLRVREHRELGIYIDKLTKHIVTDTAEAENLIAKGKKNRSVCSRSSTNLFSSSHTIFTIKFTQAYLEDGMPCEVISSIQLVDLAGSRSPHDECLNGHINDDGEAPTATHYDQSLLTLDRVISTLACKSPTSKNQIEPPYRESALTWILKDCFGGNCKTTMLAAVSPADVCHNETISTLRYANQVQKVVNHPNINEDGHVKIIKELKVEIQRLKRMLEEGQGSNSMEKQKTERKLQENQELMKRLTGIWEDKWSKTQKMIEERALEVTELGSALKFETEDPHFVSLGGGRLSIGVTICPIKRGKTVIGVSTDQSKPDIQLRGKGIESEHCIVEYNGEAVVLHPKAPLCSIDGIPVSEPTKLPQGCMLCLGKSNYFRFNHPKEAKRIREANPGNRFSIVPDSYFPGRDLYGLFPPFRAALRTAARGPKVVLQSFLTKEKNKDVELAIEQYKRDKQERDRLKLENTRLLALEKEYKEAVGRIENEKAQLEDERCQLLELERLQRDAAAHFEEEIASQIKELERQKEELRIFEDERQRIDASEEIYQEQLQRQERERRMKEEKRKRAYERLELKRAQLECIKEEDNERVAAELEIEEERQRLALLELDCLVEEVSENEKGHENLILLDEEREKLDEMKERQSEVVRQLEEELNAQIAMLKEERKRENEKIEKEKERIRMLEHQQQKALELINLERVRLEEEKQDEKARIEAEKERMQKLEKERLDALEKISKEQAKEKNMIEEEKQRLVELEKKHANSMKELEESMISQQEKIERERQIEFEFFETEQLLLEELEQKQREAAEQLDRERKIMQENLEKERQAEREKIELERKRLHDIQEQQQEALKQAEEERARLNSQLKSQRELMQKEKRRLLKLQQDCKQIRSKGVNSGGPDLVLSLTNRNLAQLAKDCTPAERKRLLIEEKRRLLELKKEAEALMMKSKKENGERSSMSSSSSGEDFESASVKSTDSSLKSIDSQPIVEELERERQKRRQLESLLEEERVNKINGEVPVNDKVKELEKALELERMRRQEMEKALHEKQKQDELERVAAEEKSRKEKMTERAIQERLPVQVKSQVKDSLNLAQHIVSIGHILENCPSAKVSSTTCKGYLTKMGGKVRKTWKKRWFVFDRQRKALMYFHDEHKKEPKGIIYFQAIQDVYAASWCSSKGPSPRTTFCVKTPQKSYYVAAPSGLAMSIWIDVILTGREGGFYNFQ